MEHRTSSRPSPSTRAARVSIGLRVAMIALAVTALGSLTGCYEWAPIRAIGVPGAKLDKQLDGQKVRYHVFQDTVETEVVKARTPYLEVDARDPETGEKQTQTIDLNDVSEPEVKVIHRDQRIIAIVAGSVLGAALFGTAIGLAVDRDSKSHGSGSIGQINLGGVYGD